MKKIVIYSKQLFSVILLSILAFAVLPISGCGDESTAPGADKYCPTKIVNFYPKDNGDGTFTYKSPETSFGTVKADGNGNCPTPTIEYKNQ